MIRSKETLAIRVICPRELENVEAPLAPMKEYAIRPLLERSLTLLNPAARGGSRLPGSFEDLRESMHRRVPLTLGPLVRMPVACFLGHPSGRLLRDQEILGGFGVFFNQLNQPAPYPMVYFNSRPFGNGAVALQVLQCFDFSTLSEGAFV
jgi:hypothetical protein